MVHLYDFWFVIVAVFWIGFFILEGFDFGVGMLHSFVGRNDLERRVAVNTIGPVWDGNEVWLIVAGAAMFAAFPAWYATMFSTFYLVLVLVLVALIFRGLSFEFRGKTADVRWQAVWQWSLTIGSALVPLLLGTGLGDLLFGLPIDENGNYTGSFIQLLVPFGLYTGITLTILCLFLGATYLTLKTTGELRDRTARLSGRLGWLAALVVLGWVVWSHLGLHEGFVPQPIDVLAILAAVAGAWFAEARSEGAAFAAGAVALAGIVGSIFFDLFPRVMVSSTDPANSLTVAGSASPDYTLKVMTVIAFVFMPVVLGYQAWSLWTFRKRLGAPPQPAALPDSPPPTDRDPAGGADRSSGPTQARVAGSTGQPPPPSTTSQTRT